VAPITPASTTKAQHELNHSRTICYGGEYVSSLPVNCGKQVEVKNLNSIPQIIIILATEYEACQQTKRYHYR
ncbi:MAG: hypothetical protein ACK53Y_00910, partial [bacterium]